MPTAQLKYSEKYNYQLDWKEIYRIPFRVTVDSRSREFQLKVLHRYLATNKFLHEIGLVPSFLCTFCERESESIEHLLIECDYSNNFWQDLINWFNMIDIKVEALSETDKIFGLWKREADFYLLNHFLILAKQHIYSCRNKGCLPSLKAYLAKVASIYQIETTIAESNGKRTFHDAKGTGKRGHIVADTLLLMMYRMLRKLRNICCGHEMFLTKIRNIFCVPDTKFVSATNVARAGKRGNICVGNNVSATMCPRLPVP